MPALAAVQARADRAESEVEFHRARPFALQFPVFVFESLLLYQRHTSFPFKVVPGEFIHSEFTQFRPPFRSERPAIGDGWPVVNGQYLSTPPPVLGGAEFILDGF